MTTSIRTDNVEKLNGGNFNRWKLQISLILEAADLWDVVTGDEVIPESDAAKIRAWRKKDVQARSVIVPTLDAAQTSHIYSCKTSKEMFDKLAAANSDASSLNKQHTTTKFLNYQMRKDQSPVQAMMEIEDLVRSLAEMKVVLDESTVITKVVTALPDAYDAFKTAWDSVPESSQTREMLMSRLKKEELKRKVTPVGDSESAETTRAFYAPQRSGTSKSEGKSNGNVDRVIKCFKCGGPHFKRDCPEMKRKERETQGKDSSEDESWRKGSWRDNSKTDNPRKDNPKSDDSWRQDTGERDSNKVKSFHSRMAFMGKTGHSVTYNGIDWISDSGASQHICGDLALFSDYTPFLTERKVLMTDNRTIQVEGRGTVELEAYLQGQWEVCTINDVLYIPGAANLFSEGTMASKGFRIVRDSQTTTFKDRDGRGPIADFNGGVYVMRFRSIRKVQTAFLTRVELPVMEKQGHLFNSMETLNLVKMDKIDMATQTLMEDELFETGESPKLESMEINIWFDTLDFQDYSAAVADWEVSNAMKMEEDWSDAVEFENGLRTLVEMKLGFEPVMLVILTFTLRFLLILVRFFQFYSLTVLAFGDWSWTSVKNGSEMQTSTVVIFIFLIWFLFVYVCMFQNCSLRAVEQHVTIEGKFSRISQQKSASGSSQQLYLETHLDRMNPDVATSQLLPTSKMKKKLQDNKRRLQISSG